MKTSSPPSSRNLFQVFLAVAQLGCVVAVLAWAFLLKRDLASAEKDVADLRGRLAPAERSSREADALRARVATLESQLAIAAAMAMEAKPQAAPVPAPASAPATPVSALAAAMNNPAMRSLLAANQKRAIETRFAELFTLLQFSPEQRTRFVELSSEAQAMQTEAGLKLVSGNLSAEERASLTQQVRNAAAETEVKIREFFGDDAKFATYKQYTEQQAERTQVNALRASLAQSGQQPLSSEQAVALTNIMYAERKTFTFTPNVGGDPTAPPTAEAMEARLRDQEMLNNRIAQRAASVLSAEQLADLRRSQANRQETIKASSEMARQLLGGAQPAPK